MSKLQVPFSKQLLSSSLMGGGESGVFRGACAGEGCVCQSRGEDARLRGVERER